MSRNLKSELLPDTTMFSIFLIFHLAKIIDSEVILKTDFS